MLDWTRPYPGRSRRRRAFHIKEFTGYTVRVTLHDHRAAGNVGKKNSGDAEVVTKQVAFCQPKFRKVNLAQVGQRDAPPVDLEGYIVDVARYRGGHKDHMSLAIA